MNPPPGDANQQLTRYEALLKKDLDHPIEEVGRQLRARMSWLNPPTNAG